MKPKYIVWMCRFRRVYLEALLPDDEGDCRYKVYGWINPPLAGVQKGEIWGLPYGKCRYDLNGVAYYVQDTNE